MPLPLPNLDDRRWQDLTQEALPLIPRYAPQWTDFNAHDPGVTIMELYAWLTESLAYRLNQVPDRFRWKFVELLGYARRGPLPGFSVIAFQRVPAGPSIHIPLGVEFASPQVSGPGSNPPPILFATTRALDLVEVTLSAVQVDDGSLTLRDYSRDASDGLPVTALGQDPQVGSSLYLGFDKVPLGSPVAVWLRFGGNKNGEAERRRLMEEAQAQKAACHAPGSGWPCSSAAPAVDSCSFAPTPVPPHHSAGVIWEVFAAGVWTALTAIPTAERPVAGEVADDTRSLTLNGLVEFNLPPAATRTSLGSVAASLFYLRVRLTQGAYDAPVVLDSFWPNAVAAVQRVPLHQTLSIAGTVLPLPGPPSPGSPISLQFSLSVDLTIQSITTEAPGTAGQPAFQFLNYVAPLAGAPGSITLELAIAGLGTAVPSQQAWIPGAPVQNRCLKLFTHDGTNWTEWKQVADFEASRRSDLAFTLNPESGLITCGDGEHGQVFPQSNTIVVTGFATLGAAGNIKRGAVSGLARSPLNNVLLSTLSAADQALLATLAANPAAAGNGEDSIVLTTLEGDAAAVVHAHERILDLANNARQLTLDQIPKSEVLALPAPTQAVTSLDTERIALAVPGTVVARARAWTDTDPNLPGLHATGVVTIVILPDMPVPEPMPSAGLIAAVKRYLDRRRVVCTRLEVAAPVYVVITVSATVQLLVGASRSAVQAAILAALDNFLSPLTGGPAGLGWPFGRFVYRAEILHLLANVPGVDHVNSMTLSADQGKPQCGDIALCPTFLGASGPHAIQVVNS